MLKFAIMLMMCTAVVWAAPVTLTGKGLTPAADGAFALEPNSLVMTAELIPVEPAKTYVLSGEFRSVMKPGENPSGILLGVIPFDASHRQISRSMVCIIPDTATTLATPLKVGDKSLLVKDASKWSKAANCNTVAFNVKEDFSDLPNRQMVMLITKITQENGLWRIDFSIPSRIAMPEGTAVRQQQEGGYLWFALKDKTFKESAWTVAGNSITGEALNTAPMNQFWKGTRFVKIVMRRSKGAAFEFRNLTFNEEK